MEKIILETKKGHKSSRHGYMKVKLSLTHLDSLLQWGDWLMKGEKWNNFILTLAKLLILPFITIFSENLRKCRLYKQMGRWIAKLPNCETVEVVSNISKTRWRPVTNKVPQDLVLGLLLFIILINSLDGGVHPQQDFRQWKEQLCCCSKGSHQAEGVGQKELHDVQQIEIPSPTYREE